MDPGWLAGLGTVGIVLIILIPLIIEIAILVWVYKDAKKRGENAVLWLVIVLFFNCIGCIVYLIVRKK